MHTAKGRRNSSGRNIGIDEYKSSFSAAPQAVYGQFVQKSRQVTELLTIADWDDIGREGRNAVALAEQIEVGYGYP